MKNFCCYSLILFIFIELVFTQSEPFNICGQNNGNIEIKEAFRWKSNLFFFAKNDINFKVNDFKWDRDERKLSYRSIDRISSKEWNSSDIRLLFTVDYPGKGLSLIEVDFGLDNDIPQMVASLVQLNDSGNVIDRNVINLNMYKCFSSPHQEPMNLCTLFAKFPEANLQEQMTSIVSFPPSKDLPQRFFAYYLETPQKDQKCTKDPCFKSQRYSMIGQNYGNQSKENETNWSYDTSWQFTCFDLRSVIVNASFTLTDYILTGSLQKFDLIQFYGTDYSVQRFAVMTENNNDISTDLEKLVTDKPIGVLFNCEQPKTTTLRTTIVHKSSTGDKGPERPGPGTKEPDKGTQKPRSTSTATPGSEGGFPLFWIILIILLVLIIIGVIVWLLIPKGSGAPSSTPPPPASTKSPSGPSVDISEAGVTPTPSDTKTIRSESGI